MNKVKILLLSLSVFFIAFNSNAQLKKGIDYSGFFDTYYHPDLWSFSGGIGFPLYYGDLCGGIGCNDGFKLSYALGASLKPWPKVALGADFYYTTLAATDVLSSRNISFTSNNMEIAIYGRYYLMDDIIRKHTDMFKPTKLFKPYVMLGLSGLYYNPTAVITDTLGNISPVDEGVSFPRFGLAIPAGFGASWDITRRFSILTEIVYRYTFTDLIDGVSTVNGNPGAKDSYLTIDLKLQWTPWALRKKKKKVKLKRVPEYNFGADSTQAGTDGGGSDSTAVGEKDEELDYYEQLLKESEEEKKEEEGAESGELNYYDNLLKQQEEQEKAEETTSEEDEYYDGEDDSPAETPEESPEEEIIETDESEW